MFYVIYCFLISNVTNTQVNIAYWHMRLVRKVLKPTLWWHLSTPNSARMLNSSPKIFEYFAGKNGFMSSMLTICSGSDFQSSIKWLEITPRTYCQHRRQKAIQVCSGKPHPFIYCIKQPTTLNNFICTLNPLGFLQPESVESIFLIQYKAYENILMYVDTVTIILSKISHYITILRTHWVIT